MKNASRHGICEESEADLHSEPNSVPKYLNPAQCSAQTAAVMDGDVKARPGSTRLPESSKHPRYGASGRLAGPLTTGTYPVMLYTSIRNPAPQVTRGSPAHGMLQSSGGEAREDSWCM